MKLEEWTKQHPSKVMCGGCKATGLEHAWNTKGDLVPAEPRRPCLSCNGTGWAPAALATMEETK